VAASHGPLRTRLSRKGLPPCCRRFAGRSKGASSWPDRGSCCVRCHSETSILLTTSTRRVGCSSGIGKNSPTPSA
jgi:hypothetical protein